MKKSRFREEQMVTILREADRRPVPEVAKQHGVSAQTGIVNLLRVARSCLVKSTPPIVLSRRTSPQPIQRTRECGADGGEPQSCALGFSWTLDCERVLAGGVSRRGSTLRNRWRPAWPPGAAVGVGSRPGASVR